MTAAECRCSFFSEAMEIQLVGTSACARRGKDERLFLVSLACQQFKSHGGFHGPEFRSRAVPFSVRRRLCSGEKRPGMVSGLRVFYREPPGYTPRARVFWFPAKRQGSRRYFRALRRPPPTVLSFVHFLFLPGATVQHFDLGICQRHGNFLLVSRRSRPQALEQILTEVPTKNGVVHALTQITPFHDG